MMETNGWRTVDHRLMLQWLGLVGFQSELGPRNMARAFSRLLQSCPRCRPDGMQPFWSSEIYTVACPTRCSLSSYHAAWGPQRLSFKNLKPSPFLSTGRIPNSGTILMTPHCVPSNSRRNGREAWHSLTGPNTMIYLSGPMLYCQWIWSYGEIRWVLSCMDSWPWIVSYI